MNTRGPFQGLQSTEIKCPGIKAFAAHRQFGAGLGLGRLKFSPIGWDRWAFGISEMEPFGRFACAERKLPELANGHSMPLRRNDDVCDLRLAWHFDLRTGRQP